MERFPAIELARRAGEIGGTLPAVLNAANEIAVEAFVNRKINFPQITETVRRTMDAHKVFRIRRWNRFGSGFVGEARSGRQ